jgi:hypothetical protein
VGSFGIGMALNSSGKEAMIVAGSHTEQFNVLIMVFSQCTTIWRTFEPLVLNAGLEYLS